MAGESMSRVSKNTVGNTRLLTQSQVLSISGSVRDSADVFQRASEPVANEAGLFEIKSKPLQQHRQIFS